MTLEQRKKLLFDIKLDLARDFYVRSDEHGEKIIVTRTGIDKIQRHIKMSFTIESITTVPYGDKVCTTVVGKGLLPDGDFARTVASANPDNCNFHHYGEIAEKRCRHRLLLQLGRLYEWDIYSEIESNNWTETSNKYLGAVANVEKMLKI